MSSPLDDTRRLTPAIDIDDRSGATGGNRALQLPVHTTEMYGAFSPDRSRLLTGGDGRRSEGPRLGCRNRELPYELTGHTQPVAALAWSDDQQWIASGAFDQSVRVWDVRSGNCLFVLEGHRPYVRSVAFGQSREQLLSAAGDGVVRLWALPAAKQPQVFEGHTDGVYHAIFDASHSRVLSGGRDRTIRLWDISTARCVKVIEGAGNPCPMSGVARRPAAVPVLRPRYPALGRGDWRVPADFSGPQRHDSIRGMEPRLSPCSFGLP